MVLKTNLNISKWLIILFSMTVIHHAHADSPENTNFDIFKYHDPNSKITINYENLTSLLKATVVRARMSSRVYAQRPQAGKGSKINFANPNPTRLEGSRVLYSYLKNEDKAYIQNLRLAMEALPEAINFRTLNRNEQLAFWLNLYNITVFEQITKRYPIRKLKSLRMGTGKQSSLWDEKLLNIYGITLSLNDIQYEIIQKIWPDPLVIYGMYHGSIGGPNIPNKAFTGENLYNLLEYNAEEFINSLRGLRFRGKDALVSEMYQWNEEFFPDLQTDLRRHLRKYTNYMLTIRLDTSKTIKTTSYDWYITDVKNASVTTAGGHISTNPAAMAGNRNLPHTGIAWDTAVINNRLKNNSAAFLIDFLKYNNKNAKTKITIEEIEKKDLKK